MGPLIRPPAGDLERALKELELGEQWAVRPRLLLEGNPHLVSPGVKWGTQPESVTHCTEFFGPVLAVMRARDLYEAIDLVNATGYGLTSGLESLDEREHEVWQAGVRAGNLYINRSTTGAIVLRQPFGGMGKSAVGPGIKAGGPNYVAPLMEFQDEDADGPHPLVDDPRDSEALEDVAELHELLKDLPEELAKHFQAEAQQVMAALASCRHWMREEFGRPHDHFRLLGEDNFRLYLPVHMVRLRVHEDDSLLEIFVRAAAARAAGCLTTVSSDVQLGAAAANAVELLDQLTESWAGAIEFVEGDRTTSSRRDSRWSGQSSTVRSTGACFE